MPQPIALVTGATAGIGRATAFALGRAGYAVGVTARTPAKVERLLRELETEGTRAAGQAADVGRPDAVAALVSQVSRELGPIDTLVNNAGVFVPRAIREISVDDWDLTFQTNVRGVFLMTQAVLPGMVERQAGDIVNVVSLAGKNGLKEAGAYSASKHAVLGFSRSLMLEVRKLGIRVIAICPGTVDTALMRNQSALTPDLARSLHAEDVATAIGAALGLPRHAMVSELDLRPANP